MVRNEYPLLFNIEISDRSLALKCFQLFFFHTRTLAESVRIQMGMRDPCPNPSSAIVFVNVLTETVQNF